MPADTYQPNLTPPRIIRILSIDQRIRDNTFPNATSLARELGVSSRSIMRDIDKMRMDYDAPITYNDRKKGYCYANPEWKLLLSVTLDDQQVQALILARRIFSTYAGTPLFDKASRAFDDMRHNGIPIEREESMYSFGRTPTRHFFQKLFPRIEDAIRYRFTIDVMLLDSYRNGIRNNLFDPYLLHYERSKDVWYFLGRCHTTSTVRVIGLHRIKMVTFTERHFEIPANFSPDPFLDANFRDEHTTGKHIVRLHFSERGASILRKFPMIHRHQQMDYMTDGSLLVFIATDYLEPVQEWLLEFGPFFGTGLRILAPDELLSMVPPGMRDRGPYPEGLREEGLER